MHFLPDTSALAKRYLIENGSEVVRQLLRNPTSIVHICQLTRTEFASTLARRHRDGQLDLVGRDRLWRLFLDHEERSYETIIVTDLVQAEAERLLFSHTLRAVDAIQLASATLTSAVVASNAESFIFLTADRRQADAAEAEGLTVEFVG